jgi:Ser/Thr protein kinase RdoA (MazF antagonist)
MLSPADEALIRRDAALPGLRGLLDEDAFLAEVRRLNPSVDLTSARLRYLRYKPGTNCLASYEIGARGQVWLVHGKALSPAEFDSVASSARSLPREYGSRLRGGVVEGMGCLIRVFPSDAKLESLEKWMDPVQRRQILSGREAFRVLEGTTNCEVLNYKAERRWVGRLVWADGSPAAVLKIHADDGFVLAHAAAKSVRSGTRYEVSKYVGKARRHGALVFDWREGQGLESMLERGEASPSVVGAVGAGLAEFHRQPPSARLSPLRVGDLAAELVRHATAIGGLVPALQRQAEKLGRTLSAIVASVEAPSVIIHGDFYAKQVLWRRGALTLLDMDEARNGPAWVDPANFLAHLEAGQLEGRLSFIAARVASEALIAGYEDESGAALPEQWPALVAARLFVQTCHCFRRRTSNWAELMARWLDRVEVLASEGGGVRGIRALPPPSSSVEATADPSMPFLGRALDVVWMDRRLRQLGAAAMEPLKHRPLVAAALIRHKPGRRCVIEYRFSGEEAGDEVAWLGKARSRQGRGWATRVAEDLRAAGLDEHGWVSVPEPLGEVPEVHMELQRRVGGETVFKRMEAETSHLEIEKVARRCAEAIHRLHVSGVRITRTHTLADELGILRGRLTKMRVTHAGWSDRLDALMVGCERLAATLEVPQACLIHRDFYPDQVLVEGDRFWLLDLDLCAMGDACLDHGNFMAHLIEWSFRRFGRREPARSGEAAYGEAALRWAGAHGARRLEAHTTLALARLVQIGTQFPDREPWVSALLELCEQRLNANLEGGTKATANEPRKD